MSITVASSSSALGNEQLRETAQLVFKIAELSAQKAALHFADLRSTQKLEQPERENRPAFSPL